MFKKSKCLLGEPGVELKILIGVNWFGYIKCNVSEYLYEYILLTHRQKQNLAIKLCHWTPASICSCLKFFQTSCVLLKTPSQVFFGFFCSAVSSVSLSFCRRLTSLNPFSWATTDMSIAIHTQYSRDIKWLTIENNISDVIQRASHGKAFMVEKLWMQLPVNWLRECTID